MRSDAETDGLVRWAEKNDLRVTRVVVVMRKLRVDELPQLLNVLRGHMSLVGPRPERPHFVTELAQKIPYYVERHCVKPGITGWAQLCYPYGSSEQDAIEKLQYDLYYIKNNSLLFDLSILLQTVEVVFSCAQSTSFVSEFQYGSSVSTAVRGSVPVTINPSRRAVHRLLNFS